MYRLEVYKDLDTSKVITYSSLSEAKHAAEAIMKHKLEEDNTYCMIWAGKKMVSYYNF